MGKQVISGTKFEAAVLEAGISAGLKYKATTRGDKLRAVATANAGDADYTKMYKQASRMISILMAKEKEVAIYAVPQSHGVSGDPRDLIVETAGGGEAGISCKHNSDEVRSKRFGPGSIDEFVGYKTTPNFKRAVRRLHKLFDQLAKKHNKFGDIPSRVRYDVIYQTITNAFAQLIVDLNSKHTDFAADFFKSIFGTHDYYLFMGGKEPFVEGMNINGTLNVKKIRTPKDTILAVMTDGKNHNYVRLLFRSGWVMSYRVKNGDSRISKNVLKCTISIDGRPTKTFRTSL